MCSGDTAGWKVRWSAKETSTYLLRTISVCNRCWNGGTERKVTGSFCDHACLYKIVAVHAVSVVEIFPSGQKCRVDQPIDIFTAKTVPLPWRKNPCFPMPFPPWLYCSCALNLFHRRLSGLRKSPQQQLLQFKAIFFPTVPRWWGGNSTL